MIGKRIAKGGWPDDTALHTSDQQLTMPGVYLWSQRYAVTIRARGQPYIGPFEWGSHEITTWVVGTLWWT